MAMETKSETNANYFIHYSTKAENKLTLTNAGPMRRRLSNSSPSHLPPRAESGTVDQPRGLLRCAAAILFLHAVRQVSYFQKLKRGAALLFPHPSRWRVLLLGGACWTSPN
ncbi:hypothetical protein CRG98_014429 [Punica granatum]|uniref:Uncharacterized protein n=1 Tax=Punica granatum TaxID=22663 RepID=A0A2I0K9A2_PUNGR|nr:hypothetical protein CRG98_014429 [Punica granatum]